MIHAHDTWFYWLSKNALHECFITEHWCGVWMEMLQLTKVLTKCLAFEYDFSLSAKSPKFISAIFSRHQETGIVVIIFATWVLIGHHFLKFYIQSLIAMFRFSNLKVCSYWHCIAFHCSARCIVIAVSHFLQTNFWKIFWLIFTNFQLKFLDFDKKMADFTRFWIFFFLNMPKRKLWVGRARKTGFFFFFFFFFLWPNIYHPSIDRSIFCQVSHSNLHLHVLISAAWNWCSRSWDCS